MDDSTPLKCCSACGQEFPDTRKYFYDGYTRCKPCARKLRQKRYIPPEGRKRCSKCHEIKQATTEFFHHSQKERDHLTSRCRECINASKRKNPLPIPVPEGYKRCPQCQEIKPATFAFYHRRFKDRDKLYPWCKVCVHKYPLEHHKLRVQHGETHRMCTGCKQTYPATLQYFHRHRTGLNGLRNICKQCVSIWGVGYREENKEIVQNNLRQWRLRNREHVLNYSRQYYYSHYEQCTQRWHRYYQLHKGDIRQYWRKHKDRANAYTHNRRARLKNIPGTYTDTQIAEQLKRQHYHCYYAACGFAKFERKNGRYVYHIEHTIPTSRTECNPHNEISHLVLACPSCNLKKGRRLPHEWFEGGRLL